MTVEKLARDAPIFAQNAEEQVLEKPGIASLALATMVKGVEAAIAAASRHAQDIKVSEGTLD